MMTESDQAKAPPEQPPTTEPSTAKQPVRKIKIGSQRDAPAADKPEVLATPPKEAPVEPTPSEPVAAEPAKSFPPPRIDRVSDELQREIDEALAGESVEALLAGETQAEKGPEPELENRYRATVVKLHREDCFFALPGAYEGFASLKQFAEPPNVGDIVEVTVVRFNADEGLYELSMPGAASSVGDWSDLEEGMIVEAKITGHNTGGLECEVNKIRGFIPMSQISIYRVDDVEQFVNEKMTCIVTEANPEKRNLVLSRRAVLEREKAAAQEELMEALEVGQVREGIVRSIKDFGAFVDLGGVDGLIHISQLSWDRVDDPREVVEEGQKVKVKIEKIDSSTGRIGLSYRDLVDHPWKQAEQKFNVGSIVTGTVSKIMEFGAFVRLDAGIEGLVHISELAHHRVVNVSSVVSEGQQVEVKVLSIDPDAQRMSLSIKAVQQAPAKSTGKQVEEEDEPLRDKATRAHDGPLKGGTNRPSGGDQFGLKW
jgi:small subunit ribosomal protein S1